MQVLIKVRNVWKFLLNAVYNVYICSNLLYYLAIENATPAILVWLFYIETWCSFRMEDFYRLGIKFLLIEDCILSCDILCPRCYNHHITYCVLFSTIPEGAYLEVRLFNTHVIFCKQQDLWPNIVRLEFHLVFNNNIPWFLDVFLLYLQFLNIFHLTC